MEFNRVVLQYDARGTPKRFYTDGIDVPYYGDLPFQHTQGYVTLLNFMNPFAPKVHVIFGAKRGRGGARARLNLMDFHGGLAVLPSLQKDDVATGSLIHQHLRLMMTRDLGRSVVTCLENEASRVPASGIFGPQAIPNGLQDTARYLHQVHGQPGLCTDKLAIFPDETY